MSRINILQSLILCSIIAFAACDSFTTKSDSKIKNNLSISLGKVKAIGYGKDKKQVNIKLKVEGGDAKNIEGYKFTELSISSNGQEFEAGKESFLLEPIYESTIKGEERKNWFKPSKEPRMSDRHVRKFTDNNIFNVPGIITKTDNVTPMVDLKGILTLVVASEENGCACRVKDFLAKGKLTNKPLKFNGGNIKFIKEPIYDLVPEDARNEFHMIKLLLEDTKERLFDIYFEDVNGKELDKNQRGYNRPSKEEKNIYEVSTGFNNIEPKQDWTMVVVYGHDNCRVTIPFEFKNINILK